MNYLYYDCATEVFSLKTPDGVVFLGPMAHTMLMLQSDYGCTESQARSAAIQAIMNRGEAVSIDDVKRIATYEKVEAA